MDIIAHSFFSQSQVDLKVLLQAFHCLIRLQQTHGHIPQDFVKAVVISTNILTQQRDIEFHIALIVESILTPVLESGSIRLHLGSDFITNEVKFLQGLLKLVDQKCGREVLGVQLFKSQVAVYLSPLVSMPTWKIRQFLKPKHPGNFTESTSPKTAAECNDKIIRFLAHVRKLGMDILFPQNMHDKVKIPFADEFDLAHLHFTGAGSNLCYSKVRS
jgi:hypothetical protein